MKIFYRIIIIYLFFLPNILIAKEVDDWLKIEIDKILNAYKDTTISNSSRFNLIEETINNNFAGAGIAKFVAGESWRSASKNVKKDYISLFKKHLALNIASLMQGYSTQNYKLSNSKFVSFQFTFLEISLLSSTAFLYLRFNS